jgi:hypothetical protein
MRSGKTNDSVARPWPFNHPACRRIAVRLPRYVKILDTTELVTILHEKRRILPWTTINSIVDVEQILAAKRANPTADVSALRRESDCLVYALYGLTAEEIAIVEGQIKK